MASRARTREAGIMSDSQYKRLTRSRDERMIAGVAGGIARYAGVDPVVVRILFVVLTLFGGGGAVLYLICWILMKEDGF